MSNPFRTPQAPAPMNVGQVAADARTQNTGNAYENASFNRPNQTNTYGTTSQWAQSGTDERGNPVFSQSSQFGATPAMFAQGLTGLGQDYFAGAGQMLSDRPDLSSSAAFDRAQDFASSTLDRQFGLQKDALDNKLKNQGLEPGTTAYDNAMRSTLDAQGDQKNSMISGIQSQLFGQSLADRNQKVGEFQSLTSPGLNFGNQAINAGQSGVPGVSVGNVDVAGLNAQSYQQQMAAYQAQMQRQNAMLGGLAGLGGAALMAPMTGGASLGGMIGGAAMGGFRGLGNAASSGYNYAFPPAYQNYAMNQQQGPV